MSILSRLRKKHTVAQKEQQVVRAEKVQKSETQKSDAAPAKSIAERHVLVRPVITEKATVTGTYVFEVPIAAGKIEIAQAVERLYGVKPLHVRTMRVEGKQVRAVHRIGRRKDWKKAIVRLPAGKTINVYEGT